jgi:hypothetical protein
MVSDVVLTKNSVGKEAFLQGTYAFAPKYCSRIQELIGMGDHAGLQSYDLAAMTELSL